MFCSSCGHKTGKSPASKGIETITRILIFLIAFIIIAMGFRLYEYKRNQQIDDQAKLEKTYERLLYNTGFKIETNSKESILMCAQIPKSWSTAIDAGEDFNEAIRNTFRTAEDSGLMRTFRDDKKSIDEAMSDLNNPSEWYKELYDRLLSLYMIDRKSSCRRCRNEYRGL